jgi:hypothetical protein
MSATVTVLPPHSHRRASSGPSVHSPLLVQTSMHATHNSSLEFLSLTPTRLNFQKERYSQGVRYTQKSCDRMNTLVERLEGNIMLAAKRTGLSRTTIRSMCARAGQVEGVIETPYSRDGVFETLLFEDLVAANAPLTNALVRRCARELMLKRSVPLPHHKFCAGIRWARAFLLSHRIKLTAAMLEETRRRL